jgi:CDP-diacylglycerol--glycerol-3-phosphate 3-phosphatidyltransferase
MGAVLGGLAIFFARNDVLQACRTGRARPMVAITLLGIIGTFLVSYTRARAESLGIDAKVGMMQRPGARACSCRCRRRSSGWRSTGGC